VQPVQVTRFILAGTIEEQILNLQDKKKTVSDGALGDQKAKVRTLSVRDVSHAVTTINAHV
jgi:SNF2 family DNA or RNA helicase